jgi:hypothetical protein
MGMSPLNVNEVPGGLFTMEHWIKIAVDLLRVLMEAYPNDLWRGYVKPQTKQWAEEYLEWVKREDRIAKERALAKLTFEDKVVLGLENAK